MPQDWSLRICRRICIEVSPLELTGSQALVYVFPAGNNGGINIFDRGGNDGGSGGPAGTITSPGTAKNVITVGAVEQNRNITQ